MNIPNCNLCRNNVADKMNSHIIPKFLSKSLFEETKPRHSLSINNKGKQKNIQDTPKENNILCSNCEKRIEIIETYFARKINDIHNFKNLKEEFELERILNQEYLVCKKINPYAFKLFIYSIVWRVSISKLNEFNKFKIEKNIEEEIRIFLNDNLKSTHKEILDVFSKINTTPKYDFCIIKPKVKSKKSRGLFTAYNTTPSSHLLMIVDFSIYFFSNNITDYTFKFFSNIQNNIVIIVLAEMEKWKEMNKSIVHKMLENKNGS